MWNITQRRKPTSLQLQKGINEVKNTFWPEVKQTLGSGEGTNFWKDKWLDYEQLCHSYPRIYDICGQEDKLV